MNAQNKVALIAALMATALVGAGCSDRTHTTADKKGDRAAPNVAAATDRTAAKVENAAAKTVDKVDDAALTGKVKTALAAEPTVSALKIDVDTKDNVVTLTGTVDTPTAKERA